jgi:hypothetical protein
MKANNLKKNRMPRLKRFSDGESFLSEKTLKRNNILLFAALFILIFLRPLLSFVENSVIVFNVSLSLLILSGVSSLDFDKRKMLRLSYAALFSLALIWLDFFISSLELHFINFIALILFFIYITYSMIHHVAKQKRISPTLILNAVNSYLLLGVISAMLFLLSDIIYQFANGVKNATISFGYTNSPTLFDYVYFAFITMTTVGYGEATPAVPLTKSLAMLTALTAQLYLTILVAMLVSKFLSQENDGE